MTKNYHVQAAAALLEQRLQDDHLKYFLGCVRTNLSCLEFERDSRDCDPQIIRELGSKFRLVGCLRLQSPHHVPAIIAGGVFRDAVSLAGSNAGDVLGANPERWPMITIPHGQRVQCIHGQQRIEAAKKFLGPRDQWWIIDVYDSTISTELRESLQKQTFFEWPVTPGEIFFDILRNDSTDAEHVDQLWARIRSQDECRELRRLMSRPTLVGCFRRIATGIPAMGRDMLAGNIGTILRLKCDEWICSYLNRIVDHWATAFANIGEPAELDLLTVRALQGRSLRFSQTDREHVATLRTKGLLFGKLDEARRSRALQEWENYLFLIPSLATFFDDLKYLEDLAAILRTLFKPIRRQTLLQDMQQCYQGEQFDLHYKALVAYVMSNIEDLKSGSLRMERGQRRQPSEISAHKQFRFAREAKRLGFTSSTIGEVLAWQPDHIEAQRSLKRVSSAAQWEHHPLFEQLVERMVECYGAAHGHDDMAADNSETLEDGEEESLERRSGRPFVNAHRQSRSRLSLQDLAQDPETSTASVNAFYVRLCVFHAFFGSSTKNAMTQPAIVVNDRPLTPPTNIEAEPPGVQEQTNIPIVRYSESVYSQDTGRVREVTFIDYETQKILRKTALGHQTTTFADDLTNKGYRLFTRDRRKIAFDLCSKAAIKDRLGQIFVSKRIG